MFNTNTYTGTDGVLTLSDTGGLDPTDPFVAGTITEYFGEGGAVGRLTNVTVQVSTEVKTFHELGSHAPRELRAGNIYIRGTVDRAFINGALLKLMLGRYATEEEADRFAPFDDGSPFRIPSFTMKVFLDNLNPVGEAGNSVVTLYGVMFDIWNFAVPEEDFVLEQLSFQARRIATTDTAVGI